LVPADSAKKARVATRTHWGTRMENGMALLIHLKKQKEQQKIRVDQFASIAVYEFNDKNVRS